MKLFKIFNIFKKRIVADCGHETFLKDRVEAFGESVITELPIKNGTTPYCHRCLEKMAIRCAWCGRAIFIGDPITLYSPRDKDQKMPDYAISYKDRFVGCLRWNCAETGADRAGFWYPPGRVVRVPTLIEMCMQSMQNGGDGVVFVSDLHDPKEAMEAMKNL